MKGLFVAIITPFDENFHIDYQSLTKLLKHLFSSEITGIVVLGTTGETHCLSSTEKLNLVKFIWSYNINKNYNKKIIVGIGGNNTTECIEFGEIIKDYSNYLMITVPHYNKPSQNEIYQHFKTICNYFENNKFILYNIPSRTGINMTPQCVAQCYNDFKNIVYIKESSGSINQIMDIKSSCNINIFAGDDISFISTNSLGGVGLISVLGNLIPNQLSEMIFCEDQEEQLKLFYKMYDLMKTIFIDTNPVPIKYLLQQLTIIDNCNVRLPLVGLDEENKQKLENCFNKFLKY
jgi:4-hydroxy-tetrahydrodipicolinate synthase